MQYYFIIQYRRLSRNLIEFGLQPYIGIPLVVAGFILLSVILFNRTQYASIIYPAFAFLYLSGLSDKKRISFLKLTYFKDDFRKVRFVENLVISCPFILFLLINGFMITGLLLLIGSIILVLIHFSKPQNLTIPTPFGKRPFEFTRGFRSTYWAFGFCYFLVIMAITVGNFNLGLFAIGLIYVICLGYHSYPEPFYFVWMYNCNPRQFILSKIGTAAWYSSLLAVLPTAAMLVMFADYWLLILAIPIVGILYLALIITAKYTAYPKELNLGQAFVLAVSFVMTPIALFSLIHFFPKSVNNIAKLNE